MPASQRTEIVPIAYDGGVLRLLDQTLLPAEERYIETDDWRVVAEAIRRLSVRGAPLIGIAAAHALVLAERQGQFDEAARVLAEARPTAVNLAWAIRKIAGARAEAIRAADEVLTNIQTVVHWLHEDQLAADAIMGALGAELLPEDATVLTHCNTGTLATGGIGTALGVIRTAHRQGKIRNVLVDETRPLLQGARLTAWELARDGIPYDIIVDGAAAGIIASGVVAAVLVGADRIAANGDTANKVGTYGLALAAHARGVPFYVVAPVNTIDTETRSGAEIRVEQRDADEVLDIAPVDHERAAPEAATALNPAFDVTPAPLITAIITDRGVLRPPYEEAILALAKQPAVAR